jgi:hypothetical protein
VPIPYRMATSEAWRSLSGSAVKAYVELRRRYNGGNNGDLSLSLNEGAVLLGLGKATVMRSLDELERKGFIKMTERGSWYGRRATTYAASDRMHGTHSPTNGWKAWRSPKPKRPKKQDPVSRWTHQVLDEPKLEPRRKVLGPRQNPSGS